jgi:hypothetical protein
VGTPGYRYRSRLTAQLLYAAVVVNTRTVKSPCGGDLPRPTELGRASSTRGHRQDPCGFLRFVCYNRRSGCEMTSISTEVPSPFNVFGRKRTASEWEVAQTQKRRRGACGPAAPVAFGCIQGENAQKRSANVLAVDNGARGKRTRCEDENDIPR